MGTKKLITPKLKNNCYGNQKIAKITTKNRQENSVKNEALIACLCNEGRVIK